MADIVRVTQLGIEILDEPGSQNMRATQLGVEILSEPGSLNMRVTQCGIEVLFPNVIPGIVRVTQFGIETLNVMPEVTLSSGIHPITINITN